MKRSHYFVVVSVFAAAFGLLMLLAPGFAASQFQLNGSGATSTIFRVAGSLLVGLAVLNFMVRNHAMSDTLKSILWTNATVHAVGFVADLGSAVVGDIAFSGVAVGLIVHLVVLAGTVYYLLRPNAA